jgi:hypothetical protein
MRLVERDSAEWESMWEKLFTEHGYHDAWMYMGSDRDAHYFKNRYLRHSDGTMGVNATVSV